MREDTIKRTEQAGLFGDENMPLMGKPAVTPPPAASTIRLVPVTNIRLWSGNPRSHTPFDPGRDAALTAGIKAQGQKIACIVRPLGEGLYELIVGCRRYGTVAHLAIADPDLMLLVEVREMTDIEAFILVDSENAARKDVTPYERATYQDWALAAVFGGSQTDLAASLGISATTLSRSLDLVRLPAEVKAIITDLNGLTPNMVAAIGPRCNDPATQEAVVAAAVEIAATGRTYQAGKAIGMIVAALSPTTAVEAVTIDHAATGQQATIGAGPKDSMIVTVPLARMDAKARAKFLREIAAAMPAFAARLADRTKANGTPDQ